MSRNPINQALLPVCGNPAGIDGKWEITSSKPTWTKPRERRTLRVR